MREQLQTARVRLPVMHPTEGHHAAARVIAAAERAQRERLGLLDLEDEQAARAIGSSDPAVESGTRTYEVVPTQLVRPG
jgi:hypothetical protein